MAPLLENPVFVVGCPRSGTTLLSVLLDRHSELAMTPETAFYDEIAPALVGTGREAVLGLVARWPRLAELGLRPGALISASSDLSRAGLLRSILAQYARRRRKPRCGEKTPQHLWHVPEIFNDFPKARVLCIVRDGRDTALSIAAMPWWREGIEAAAQMWLEAERRRQMGEIAYGRRFFTVRYEDLVVQPEAVMRWVMDLLDLSFEQSQLHASRSSGVVLRRSRAWKSRALEAVSPDGRWDRQGAAAPATLAYLDATLGGALARCGYGAGLREGVSRTIPS